MNEQQWKKFKGQCPTEPFQESGWEWKKNDNLKKYWEGVDKAESAHLVVSEGFCVSKQGRHNRISWLLSRYSIRLEPPFQRIRTSGQYISKGRIIKMIRRGRWDIAVVVILSRQWINKHGVVNDDVAPQCRKIVKLRTLVGSWVERAKSAWTSPWSGHLEQIVKTRTVLVTSAGRGRLEWKGDKRGWVLR